MIYENEIDSDVIICGNDLHAKQTVIQLVNRINGLRAIDAGNLNNSIYVENLTTLLVNINKTNRVKSAVRITGI